MRAGRKREGLELGCVRPMDNGLCRNHPTILAAPLWSLGAFLPRNLKGLKQPLLQMRRGHDLTAKQLLHHEVVDPQHSSQLIPTELFGFHRTLDTRGKTRMTFQAETSWTQGEPAKPYAFARCDTKIRTCLTY